MSEQDLKVVRGGTSGQHAEPGEQHPASQPAPPPAPKRSPMRRGYTALLCSLFLIDLGGAMVGIALPLLLVRDYGMSFAVGLSFAVGILPRIVASPFVGSMLVRFDPRRVAIVSALLSAPFVALIPLTRSMWEFQVVNLAIAVAGTLAGPSRLALRPMTIEPGAELQGNGLLVAAERVPAVLGPALVGASTAVGLGLRWVFVIPSGCALVAALLIFRLPAVRMESSPAAGGSGEGERQSGESESSAVENGQTAADTTEPGYLRTVARHTRLLLGAMSQDRFVAGLTLTAFTYVAAVSVGRILLLTLTQTRFPHSPDVFGWLLGAMSLGAVLGATLSGVMGRLDYGLLYIAGNVLEAVVWLGLIFVHDRSAAVAVLFVAGVLESVATVVFFAEIQRRLRPDMMGYYYSALMPLTDACGLAGFLLGGVLARQSIAALAWCVAGLIALPILATARWYRRD